MTEDQVVAALRAVADAGRAYRRRRVLAWIAIVLAVWMVTDVIDLLVPGDNLVGYLSTTLTWGGSFF